MARTKKDVLMMIERLPDEASLEDIMAELYFRMQVDAGLEVNCKSGVKSLSLIETVDALTG